MANHNGEDLNDPGRIDLLRDRVQKKSCLRTFYERAYRQFHAYLSTVPAQSDSQGAVVEIGAGASFIKSFYPEVMTTDVLNYEGLDKVLDATAMDFPDTSVRGFLLMDSFHHIPDVAKFLKEATRCLVPGGIIFMVDPYPGFISTPVYRWLHHEPFDKSVTDWRLDKPGALSSANQAMAWLVFNRDLAKFKRENPQLILEGMETHTPLLYWLSGGLKSWSLAPKPAIKLVQGFDEFLLKLSPATGSFIDIKLRKTKSP